MKQRLRQVIYETIWRHAKIPAKKIPYFTLEQPKFESHGDFACNIAMLLAPILHEPLRELATCISDDIRRMSFVAHVEVAGPGFINIFIKPEAWRAVLAEILIMGENFGRSERAHPRKVLVEFVSANPTGPLHFGHGRGAAVGDVLANLLEFSGHNVTREYYVNDAGQQVRNLTLSVVHCLKLSRGIESKLPEDGYQGEYVYDLARQLPQELTVFLPGNPDEATLCSIKDFVVRAMLANIQEDLLSFGIQMDYFASERTLLANRCVENMLAKFREKGMINERDGALWFCSDKFGDEKERVLVKKDGTNTYFATDIANHIDKLKRGFDLLINVWGADHHGYVPRMNAAIQALGERADVLDVVLVQMVSLLRDKKPVVLSKRAGEIITLRDVIDEVGRDAARFFFIMRTCASQMDFDLELAKKHSLDNPVYYVQYAYARLASILARAREKNFNVPDPKHAKEIDLSSLDLPEELRLIKKMSGFSEYIRHAADSRAPHLVVIFLQDLVREFHSYYTKYAQTCPILKGSSEHITARLILVQALQQVLHNGLRLLGVSAPKRMEPPKEA